MNDRVKRAVSIVAIVVVAMIALSACQSGRGPYLRSDTSLALQTAKEGRFDDLSAKQQSTLVSINDYFEDTSSGKDSIDKEDLRFITISAYISAFVINGAGEVNDSRVSPENLYQHLLPIFTGDRDYSGPVLAQRTVESVMGGDTSSLDSCFALWRPATSLFVTIDAR